MDLDRIVKTLSDLMKNADSKKTSGYDTTAKVIRVEDGIAWVHIPGGVDETPVKLSINATKGDMVRVRVSGGDAWLVGNDNAPPTDDTRANQSYVKATEADEKAIIAGNAAESAQQSAAIAHTAAVSAQTSANEAKVSATNANEYASRALTGLSTVQSVAETLTWITQHGTMTLTTDTAIDPSHVYFVLDHTGDYVVGNTHYTLVTEPDPNDLGSYYELSIDESLNNYVGTHLAVTEDGLWLLPAGQGTYKILIATGAGNVYTTPGTYIIGSTGGVSASFRVDGATIGEILSGEGRIDISPSGLRIYRNVNGNDVMIAHLGYGRANDDEGDTINKPYYSLGDRMDTASDEFDPDSTYEVGDTCIYNGDSYVCFREITTPSSWSGSNDWRLMIGEFSTAEGEGCIAAGAWSHAEGHRSKAISGECHSEGRETLAAGDYAHAEGYLSKALSVSSHAEGYLSKAISVGSHAEGYYTTASGSYGHSEGIGSKVTNEASHAEGYHTQANGKFSHSEGAYTQANGESAHSEGASTMAYHDYSHAGGVGTKTSRAGQTVIGQYNNNNSGALFIVGNGTDNNNWSNAFFVDNDGTVYACGNNTGEKHEAQIGAIQGAGQIYLYSQIGSGNYTNRGVYTFNSSNSGKTVYTIDSNNNITFYGSLSDLKRKNIIKDFNWKIDDFINGLKPIAYTVKNPDGNDGKRIHMGFGAQDVKKLSEDLSLGDLSLYKAQLIQRNEDGSTDEVYYDGHDEPDENLSWTLDYVEFIPMLTMEIQRLMTRVDELERRLDGESKK